MRRTAWIATALLLLTTVPASAAPLDAASSHAGLRAYRAFASSLARNSDSAARGAKAFVGGVRAGCPSVLKQASKSDAFVESVAVQFGKEAGADLVLSGLASYRKPVATLSRRIERLRWSSPRIAHQFRRALDAESRFFALMPSDLCADAAALAADGGRHFPPAARTFLSTFQHDADVAGRLDIKQTLLRYHRPGSDKRLLREINRLEDAADTRLADVLTVQVPHLLNALGLLL